jgi:hypothetical protein
MYVPVLDTRWRWVLVSAVRVVGESVDGLGYRARLA